MTTCISTILLLVLQLWLRIHGLSTVGKGKEIFGEQFDPNIGGTITGGEVNVSPDFNSGYLPDHLGLPHVTSNHDVHQQDFSFQHQPVYIPGNHEDQQALADLEAHQQHLISYDHPGLHGAAVLQGYAKEAYDLQPPEYNTGAQHTLQQQQLQQLQKHQQQQLQLQMQQQILLKQQQAQHLQQQFSAHQSPNVNQNVFITERPPIQTQRSVQQSHLQPQQSTHQGRFLQTQPHQQQQQLQPHQNLQLQQNFDNSNFQTQPQYVQQVPINLAGQQSLQTGQFPNVPNNINYVNNGQSNTFGLQNPNSNANSGQLPIPHFNQLSNNQHQIGNFNPNAKNGPSVNFNNFNDPLGFPPNSQNQPFRTFPNQDPQNIPPPNFGLNFGSSQNFAQPGISTDFFDQDDPFLPQGLIFKREFIGDGVGGPLNIPVSLRTAAKQAEAVNARSAKSKSAKSKAAKNAKKAKKGKEKAEEKNAATTVKPRIEQGNETSSNTSVTHDTSAHIQKVFSVVNTIHPNSYIEGGTLKTFATVKQCYHSCKKNSTCFGFDYRKSNKTCSLHGTPTVCKTPTRANGVVHYRMVKCGDSVISALSSILGNPSLLPPSSLPSSQQSPFSPSSALVSGGAAAAADEGFVSAQKHNATSVLPLSGIYFNTKVGGGAVVPDVNTLISCYERCKYSACAGLNFDTVEQTCTHIGDDYAECGALDNAPAITHIRMSTCGAVETTVIPSVDADPPLDTTAAVMEPYEAAAAETGAGDSQQHTRSHIAQERSWSSESVTDDPLYNVHPDNQVINEGYLPRKHRKHNNNISPSLQYLPKLSRQYLQPKTASLHIDTADDSSSAYPDVRRPHAIYKRHNVISKDEKQDLPESTTVVYKAPEIDEDLRTMGSDTVDKQVDTQPEPVNRTIHNGILMMQHSEVETCDAACTMHPGCLGTSYNLDDRTCIFYDHNNLCLSEEDRTVWRYNYRISCDDFFTGFLSVKEIEASTKLPSSQLHAVCEGCSASECLYLCYQQLAGCAAVNYHHPAHTCYIANHTDTCYTTESHAEWTLYRLEYCSGIEIDDLNIIKFAPPNNKTNTQNYPGKSYPGSHQHSLQSSGDTCWELCDSQAECEAVDFSVSTGDCYLYNQDDCAGKHLRHDHLVYHMEKDNHVSCV